MPGLGVTKSFPMSVTCDRHIHAQVKPITSISTLSIKEMGKLFLPERFQRTPAEGSLELSFRWLGLAVLESEVPRAHLPCALTQSTWSFLFP